MIDVVEAAPPALGEVELKFQIPAERRGAVARALATRSATVLQLQAVYVDTPDRRLASARMALRMRREGRQWVQTLKADTDRVHVRLEHEIPIPAPARGAVPRVDATLHDGTPAGLALRRALGDAPHTLQARYDTRITRTYRPVRAGSSLVAVTLDVGEIRAGDRRCPVHEIEFELVRGSAVDLVALCRRWARRFGLWLDLRSKAERGDRLARGQAQGEAQRASPSTVVPGLTPEQALQRMVGDALRHLLTNAADLAEGIGTAEQLHQLRVGLRRLRAALRTFGAWSPDVKTGWAVELRRLFAALGTVRERDALAQSLAPSLRAAGAPLVDLAPPADGPTQVTALLRSADVQDLFLALLAFAVGDTAPGPEGPAVEPGDLVSAAFEPLQGLHRRLNRDAGRFADLDDAARHRVRKRLKRLRYGAEFVAPLRHGKAMARYLDALRKAQEALGALNDLQVAEALYRDAARDDGRAWFAVGWLAARKPGLVGDAARHLRRLTRSSPLHRPRRARRERSRLV